MLLGGVHNGQLAQDLAVALKADDIRAMAATDFPDLPNTGAEETLTIKTGVLRDMIDRTLYAVSQDEKKPAHTGELFEILPDKLTVVALDGYRLAIVERPVKAAPFRYFEAINLISGKI